jgi:hypothetical protein
MQVCRAIEAGCFSRKAIGLSVKAGCFQVKRSRFAAGLRLGLLNFAGWRRARGLPERIGTGPEKYFVASRRSSFA